MCLIAFAIGVSQRFPLVIASNRDEFLDRPTLPLDRWQTPGGQEIISGRDLRAGGTWLGMTPAGRVAFLTNVREAEPKVAAFSRGELVTRWLESHSDAAAFASLLEKDSQRYGGFNLVLGDVQRNAWTWMTNRSLASSSGLHFETLAPGVYGLSNAALDTPWPKTLALKNALRASLEQGAIAYDDSWKDPLWAALGDRARAPTHDVPKTAAREAMEVALSSAFVQFPDLGYGTRSSTILVASRMLEPIPDKVLRIDMEEQTHFHKSADEIPVASFISFIV
ncbi:MAG: NRDE family protein [Polaromonas sp.]